MIFAGSSRISTACGALAGGRLDEAGQAADKHPPVLNARDRFGRDEDWIDYHSVLPRDGGDRVRRLPVSRHEPPRRHARLWIARCPRSPNTRCNICSCRPSSD